MSSKKVRFSIGAKLILIICAIVVLSLAGVTFLVSYFVTKDIRLSTEENNLTINARTASECQTRIDSTLGAVGLLSQMLCDAQDAEQCGALASGFFERYPSVAALYYTKSRTPYANQKFFAAHSLPQDLAALYALDAQQSEFLATAKNGGVALCNASPAFNAPVIVVFAPVKENPQEEAVAIYCSSEQLFEGFSSGSINQSVFVNHKGQVLVHSDLEQTMNAADFSGNELFAKMRSENSNNMQTLFTTAQGSQYIGAYKKISTSQGGASGAAVLTTVQLDVVLEGIRATTRRNIYLAAAVLFLAILIVWFFARSISVPIRQLADVADEINNANFNTPLFDELESKTHDEVSVLVDSTKNERSILNMITRLTNIGVVRSVIQKKVDFKPHLKDITIFFSDIRGFTKISDGFNKRFGNDSGAEIIGFLNDYMSRMVQCITLTGGVVDKFEGDAIMACWGVLRGGDLSFESLPNSDPRKKEQWEENERHKISDALSAIMSTVAMRYALRKYNKDAAIFTKQHAAEDNAKYKPQIKIGCGLNSGRATVGFMGSWEKMEFTSIGDAVNLASRTESSNKPCGTDILITQATYDILKKNFIKCKENNFTIKPQNQKFEIVVEKIPAAFEVKGKGKQYFYGVVNMPNFDVEGFFKKAEPDFVADAECLDVVGPNGPKTLKALRKLLGIAEPDFGGVNLDQEENKIQVSAS